MLSRSTSRVAIVALIFGILCESASIATSVGGQTTAASAQTPQGRDASGRTQSVGDFIAMGRVIESARCLNCHPADGYPTQADDMHRHTPRITPGHEGKGVPGFTCSQCHGVQNANTSLPHIQSVPGNRSGRLPRTNLPGSARRYLRSANKFAIQSEMVVARYNKSTITSRTIRSSAGRGILAEVERRRPEHKPNSDN